MFPLAHSRGRRRWWPSWFGASGRRACRRFCRGVAVDRAASLSATFVAGTPNRAGDPRDGLRVLAASGASYWIDQGDVGPITARPGGRRPRRPVPCRPRSTKGGRRSRHRWPHPDFGDPDRVRYPRRVAQRAAGARSSTDRASDYGSEGLGFESLRARSWTPADLQVCRGPCRFPGSRIRSRRQLLVIVVGGSADGDGPSRAPEGRAPTRRTHRAREPSGSDRRHSDTPSTAGPSHSHEIRASSISSRPSARGRPRASTALATR
jgi:hypothetical protein